jgi:hypothetical protein
VGFTPPTSIYTLDFPEGDELHGLTVEAKSVSVGVFLRLARLQDTASEGGIEALAAVDELFAAFGRSLRSWDLQDDDGQDVPATADGLRTLELRHAMAVIAAWMGGMSQAPAPLAETSPGGGPSAVELPPMEVASASLAS